MTTNDDKENDYEFTRETLYDLIVKGREGIDEFMEVARQSEHPRAYEVLAKLIKDTADTSSQLMDLHKKKKEIEKVDQPKLPPTTNNVFVGSTTDLQRMLKGVNEPKDVTVDDSRDSER
jgi:hypothetical protein